MTECPTCPRGDFGSERAMKIHHVRSHGESLNERTCPHCRETFVSRRLHTGEWQQYCCQDCEAADRRNRRWQQPPPEELREAYERADGCIASVVEEFELEYTPIYRRLCYWGIHEPETINRLRATLGDDGDGEQPDWRRYYPTEVGKNA